MATDAKKHTTIAAGETPTRAVLAAAILSIKDVIPVANVTERGQVAAAIAAVAGAISATNPVVVLRADAPTYAALEYTINGTTWFAVSGYSETAIGTSVTPVPGANYTLSNNNLYIRNGFLLGSIDFTRTSGTVSHGDTIMTLPAGARPITESAVATIMTPSPAVFQDVAVSATGAVTALSPVGTRTAGSIRFNPGLAIPY